MKIIKYKPSIGEIINKWKQKILFKLSPKIYVGKNEKYKTIAEALDNVKQKNTYIVLKDE